MNLLGTWVIDDTDHEAVADLGNVILEFQNEGALIYTIRGRSKDEIILLRYHIDRTAIVTDQPSAPRIERTEFSLSNDGVLTLAFNGVPYRFKRRE